MALASALNRGKRKAPVLGQAVIQRRKMLAMQALSPLYESIDFVSRSLVDRLKSVDTCLLPGTANSLSIEFKTSLGKDWREIFSSTDDLNESLADGVKRVGIGISSGLMHGGFKQCRVKKIRLEPESERFIIDLHWVTEPSWLKKALTRRD